MSWPNDPELLMSVPPLDLPKLLAEARFWAADNSLRMERQRCVSMARGRADELRQIDATLFAAEIKTLLELAFEIEQGHMRPIR